MCFLNTLHTTAGLGVLWTDPKFTRLSVMKMSFKLDFCHNGRHFSLHVKMNVSLVSIRNVWIVKDRAVWLD